MAESDGQERTEEATPRRLQQAREKGQVARSKELASASVLIVGAIALMWFGESMAKLAVFNYAVVCLTLAVMKSSIPQSCSKLPLEQ